MFSTTCLTCSWLGTKIIFCAQKGYLLFIQQWSGALHEVCFESFLLLPQTSYWFSIFSSCVARYKTFAFSSILFLVLSNYWTSPVRDTSDWSEFIIFIASLGDNPVYIVLVPFCIVFVVMLAIYFTNMDHLSPKYLSRTMWMEIFKFITISREKLASGLPGWRIYIL